MDKAPGSRNASTVGLGTHSARGLVYLLSSSMFVKLFGVAQQIALAWLLGETDYGVLGLAYTVTTFTQVIEHAGVGDVLIHRKRFRLWSVPAFWFALALGALGCLIVICAAPVASRIYGNEQLLWVLLVLAPASIPNSLVVVPRAKLARELRFRAIAAVNATSLILRMILTVLLAWLGFGPYSFVLPVPIVQAMVAAFLWCWVRPPWSLDPQPRRWRYLAGDSTRSLASDLLLYAYDQTDYFLLGLFTTVGQVGLYTFGFHFSVQMIQLLSVNLTQILFPALTRLGDQPQAQFQGFLKAQRILAMVGISACLLQAAAAEPLARLVFPPKWADAILPMQILSLGMATRIVAGVSSALVKSQGRFHTLMSMRLVFAVVLFVTLLATLRAGGGIVAVSVAVAIVSSVIGPVSMRVAIRPYGAGWSEVMEVMWRPGVAGVVSVGAAWLVDRALATAGYGDFVRLVSIMLIAVSLNAIAAWIWMRPVCDDLWARLRRLLASRVQQDIEPASGIAS